MRALQHACLSKVVDVHDLHPPLPKTPTASFPTHPTPRYFLFRVERAPPRLPFPFSGHLQRQTLTRMRGQVTYTVSQAIAAYEVRESEKRRAEDPEYNGKVVAAEEAHVKLYAGGLAMMPAVTTMDKDGLASLQACTRLALSSNAIDRIPPGLHLVPRLEILSLARNKLRRLENLHLPNLRQLWVSYNFIEKLSGLDKLPALTTLFLSNNCVSSWAEVDRLAQHNPLLTDVLFTNNRVHTDIDKGTEDSARLYRLTLLSHLPKLMRIDGRPVDPDEREEAEVFERRTML